MIIQENIAGTSGVKNTGSDKENLPLFTVGYALAKGSQSFASVAAFKTKAAWDAAKLAKDLVILYSVEKAELANVEPTFYESRTRKIKTKDNVKGLKVTHHLGYISHSALESYNASDYTYVYEFTSDGQVKGINQTDGTVKGQLLSDFLVGPILEPVLDGDPLSSVVEMTYENPRELTTAGCIVTPEFNILKYKGIYPIKLTIEGTPTLTELKVRATYSNQDLPLTGLDLTSFTGKVLKVDGTPQTPDSVTAGAGNDANLYTFVDADLETGTIETNVVEKTLAMFETDEATVFTV
ncbi:hypothetical protein [uncultured Wocania sp.]|uniref:hypothetical protein n=1 Tax=uncultured Wocania sp. TaxID=2834404 RepID=UPI0030FB5812